MELRELGREWEEMGAAQACRDGRQGEAIGEFHAGLQINCSIWKTLWV